MRILFVLGGLRIGGYEVLSVNIANELYDRGNKVAIISLHKDDQISGKVKPGIEAYFVVRKFWCDLSVFRKISKIFTDFRPNIVLSCAFFEYFYAKLSSFLISRKPKFILAFHVTRPFDIKEDRWNRMYASFAKLFNDIYIAVHSSQIDFYNKRYGLPRSRFITIHNGIDIEYYHPAMRLDRETDGCFQIAHIASLKPLKDQWTLLRSMVEVDKTFKRWELKIVGEDRANLLSQYESYARKHNIQDKVKFLGPVNDIRDVLANSDVFVLTSITEALPLSVIEAAAMGLPCIVTDVGGNSDIIEDGKEGFLVKPGDYGAISQYLKLLINDPSKREKIGTAARQKAIRKFDFKRMIDRYCDLFEHVLQK